jgi:hypothetical protein
LQSEDDALAAGYTQADILQYKSSFEYFQRVNGEHVSTNVSLQLQSSNQACLLEGAAGLVLPRYTNVHTDPAVAAATIAANAAAVAAANANKTQQLGDNTYLSIVRGGGRKMSVVALWDQIGGVHIIPSTASLAKVTASCEKIMNEINGGGLSTGLNALIVANGINGGQQLIHTINTLMDQNVLLTVVYPTATMEQDMNGVVVPRLFPDFWTVDIEQYYILLMQSRGVTFVIDQVSAVKIDDETGWVDRVMLGTTGSHLKTLLAIVVSGTTTGNADGADENIENTENTDSAVVRKNAIYGKWSWISAGLTDVTAATSIVPFGDIKSVLSQEAIEAQLSSNTNQKRRREAQGLNRELILGGGREIEHTGVFNQLDKHFGLYYLDENGTVAGGFFEGGTAQENQLFLNKIGKPMEESKREVPSW